MRASSLLLLILPACQGPDRWNAGVSRGDGTLDGYKQDYDIEDTTFEVGISGPLWSPRGRCSPERPPEPFLAPAPPTAQPEQPGDLPWGELILLLVGAGGWKASEVGYRNVSARRAARRSKGSPEAG